MTNDERKTDCVYSVGAYCASVSKKSQAFISALVPVLAQTGFHTVEITMESSEAAASINAIKRNDPSFFVGAGTVKPLRMLIEHWMPAQTLSSRQSSMRQ